MKPQVGLSSLHGRFPTTTVFDWNHGSHRPLLGHNFVSWMFWSISLLLLRRSTLAGGFLIIQDRFRMIQVNCRSHPA
jgi:hypothetical protein